MTIYFSIGIVILNGLSPVLTFLSVRYGLFSCCAFDGLVRTVTCMRISVSGSETLAFGVNV